MSRDLRFPILAVCLAAGLLLLAGCGAKQVEFRYPSEQIQFPKGIEDLPKLYVSGAMDLRPEQEIDGSGRLLDVRFPADRNLDRPVADIYRTALTTDIDQTGIGLPTALPSHAEYVLEPEIFTLGCRLQRQRSIYFLPLGAGMMLGFFMADDTSGRLKYGSALTFLAMGAIPVPATLTARCEVRLTLRDTTGATLWQETCVGEVMETIGESAVSRRDKALAEKYLPQAVKRCNACLLGQLRQYLAGL